MLRVSGDPMVLPHPLDVTQNARSSYYYNNVYVLVLNVNIFKGISSWWTNGNDITSNGVWIWPIYGSDFTTASSDVYSNWASGNVSLSIISDL